MDVLAKVWFIWSVIFFRAPIESSDMLHPSIIYCILWIILCVLTPVFIVFDQIQAPATWHCCQLSEKCRFT